MCITMPSFMQCWGSNQGLMHGRQTLCQLYPKPRFNVLLLNKRACYYESRSTLSSESSDKGACLWYCLMLKKPKTNFVCSNTSKYLSPWMLYGNSTLTKCLETRLFSLKFCFQNNRKCKLNLRISVCRESRESTHLSKCNNS